VIVVGDGPERAELERAFPQVTFAGQLGRDEALTYIAAADAVISASRKEGSPSVAREARLLRTRLVAVAAGDLVERYSQDDAVIVVDW
jgi:teichuronic acid biosynthesis glycosyltransferase TuaC